MTFSTARIVNRRPKSSLLNFTKDSQLSANVTDSRALLRFSGCVESVIYRKRLDPKKYFRYAKFRLFPTPEGNQNGQQGNSEED